MLYVMGDMEADIRTYHIHIVKWNGTEWKNYIHFRDYLKANENMALQYENFIPSLFMPKIGCSNTLKIENLQNVQNLEGYPQKENR